MHLQFVINPHAGHGQEYSKLATAIQAEFSGWDIRILPHALSRPYPDLVVAVGGDGTVNSLLNSIAGSGVPLGILPCGTSNDLAHALGIPRHFERACKVIKQARWTAIDLVSVNDSFFATCGGIGLPAAVAVRANRWRQQQRTSRAARLLGRGIYPLAAFRAVGDGAGSVWARVSTRGVTQEGAWTAVIVSNQPRFGGFSVAPHASNRDGLLDLCEIHAPHRPMRLLDIVCKGWQGRPEDCPEMSLRSVRTVNLFTQDAVPFMGDGEILQSGTEFHIRVVPEALRVVVPETEGTTLTAARKLRYDSSQQTGWRRCG